MKKTRKNSKFTSLDKQIYIKKMIFWY